MQASSIRSILLGLSILPAFVLAQLSGRVGPSTSTSSKVSKKVCNVLNYGAKADQSTDLGPALAGAWAALYVPPGNYAQSTWATLDDGTGVAIQIDGIIYRTGTAGGTMIVVENSSDIELYSQTSKGAIQGYGYKVNHSGPRLVRFVGVENFSIHDIILVDSPEFFIVMDTCSNGEVYNTIIRGASSGGLDGIDIWGSNIYVHDVEVTNKDECVTVKSPANNIFVEDIYCNWSGGSAIGSLSTGTAITSVSYNRVYTWQSNQMFLIKSNGGSGYVRDSSFTNFIGHSNAYALDIDGEWSSQTAGSGNGVVLTNLTFSNWQGSIIDTKRATIQALCYNAPCTELTFSNIALWSDSGSAVHEVCGSAYGSGGCLKGSGDSVYSPVTVNVNSAPAGYNGAKMSNDLAAGYATNAAIPIPSSIPTSFYPGQQPKSALCNGACAGATNAAGSGSTGPASTTPAGTTPTGGSCAALYGQCGGTGWTGPSCCASGKCTVSNQYYSQCL